MYKIIGSDGQEYGPVPADTLRLWISQGRANTNTRVLVEGSTDWRELGSVPEFAQAFATRATQPARPTTPSAGFAGQAEADKIAQEVIQNDYRFNISDCFGQAWDLVAANFWPAVGASALVLLITAAASIVPFATLLLTYVLLGGLDWMFLSLLRNGKAEVNDVFAGFSLAFVPLMLFSLVSQILVGLGTILCVLPGIFLLVVWTPFTALLIMDKRLEFWPAMELSRKVVSHHWWHMLGLLLLCMLVNIAGLLLCGIGIFFTFPLTTAVIVVAYEQVFGRGAPQNLQAPAATQSGSPPCF